MRIFDKARGYLALKALQLVQTYSLTDPSFGRALRGNSTYSSKPVDENTALQISTVWACSRILSTVVGYLPWAIYQEDKVGNLTKIDHDLGNVLMDSPNTDMSDLDLKEAKVANLSLSGNAYSMVERRTDGSPISIYPVPSILWQKVLKDDGTVYYKVLDRGQWVSLPQEKVWNVHGFGRNGLVGYSPVAYAREAMGLALASEEFQARFFSQGASPGWLLSVPNWLTENQREEARKIIDTMWGGLPNAHRARLLEGGMTATPSTMPLADAQFLELRNFSVPEICRLFGIPPHMVADLQQSTNNNIEHQGLEFLTYGLQPYLARLETAARRQLLSSKDRRAGIKIKFNVTELLRADSAAKAVLFPAYVNAGIMNRNEVRAIEGWNQVADLGVFTCGVNIIPINRLDEYANKLVQLQQAPVAKPPGTEGAQPSKTFVNVSSPVITVTPLIQVEAGKAPTVNVDARTAPAEVNVSAPVVHVAAAPTPNVTVLPAEVTVVTDSKDLGEKLDRLTDRMDAPTELILDDKGEVTGARRAKG